MSKPICCVIDWIVFPQNLYTRSPNHKFLSMWLFGDRAVKEVKMRPSEWALIQSDWCPYKKKRLGHTGKH